MPAAGGQVIEPPPPLPQALPVPETTPALFACKHWVEPVTLVVRFPVALSVVNAPAAGVVLPIGGGEAKSEVIPAPDTVDVAESVVNAPAAGVVLPIGGGEAKSEVNPAPETVDVAERVVNEPAAGVVPPMGGGVA